MLKRRHSEVKSGLRDRSTLRGESQKRVLLSFLSYFLLSDAKRSTIKAFLEVGLVLLTLTARTVFFFFLVFEKTQAISLDWFAAQQQTST